MSEDDRKDRQGLPEDDDRVADTEGVAQEGYGEGEEPRTEGYGEGEEPRTEEEGAEGYAEEDEYAEGEDGYAEEGEYAAGEEETAEGPEGYAEEGEYAEGEEETAEGPEGYAEEDEYDEGEEGYAEGDEYADEQEDQGAEDDGDAEERHDAEDAAAAGLGGARDDDDDAAVQKVTRRGGKKRKKKKATGMTPGERLAAAKAAKAEKKSKERGKEAEVLEDEANRAAEQATDWLTENRQLVLGGLGLAAAAAVGLLIWSAVGGVGTEAAAALWEGVDASLAPVVPEGEEPPPGMPDDTRTYATLSARAEEASDAYEAVVQQHGGSGAAVWASLARGNELLTLERPAEARESFESALATGGDDAFVEWRALEGIAFSFEQEESWDAAVERFTQLRDRGDSYEDIADYHLARMYMRQGENDQAKELLEALLARLESTERADRPELTFVSNQARLRLTELDPTAATTSSAPNLGSGLENLPPEILEQLRQQGLGQ